MKDALIVVDGKVLGQQLVNAPTTTSEALAATEVQRLQIREDFHRQNVLGIAHGFEGLPCCHRAHADHILVRRS